MSAFSEDFPAFEDASRLIGSVAQAWAVPKWHRVLQEACARVFCSGAQLLVDESSGWVLTTLQI
jgi:hypothetical protein